MAKLKLKKMTYDEYRILSVKDSNTLYFIEDKQCIYVRGTMYGGGSGGSGGAGQDGEDGITFTPHISDDGILSWTNNGGLPNPDPINIVGKSFTYEDFTESQLAALKGKDGEKGDAGTAGKDGIDGKDGISPVIEVEEISNGHRVIITDAEGEQSFDVLNGVGEGGAGVNGKDGEDGATFIPHLSESGDLSWTNNKGLENPETVNIKGKDGADGYTPQKGIDYFDGKDGSDGASGKDGKDGTDGYTPQKGIDYFDGENGQDGISVTHEWNGTTLTVTSASGTSSADLKGEDGLNGKDGHNWCPVLEIGEDGCLYQINPDESVIFTLAYGGSLEVEING